MSPRGDESGAIATRAGPSIRLTTASALLGVAVVVGGLGTFLVGAGARGGEASERLKTVERNLEEQARVAAAHAETDARVRSDLAVHQAQIDQISKALTSLDRKLERVLERLPPAGTK